jgi:RimJ/RimL family protein N-acetyltransferase
MSTQGKVINLRAIEREDLAILKSWANDEVVNYGIGEIYNPSSSEIHEEWFKKTLNDPNNIRLIAESHDGEVIGLSSIVGINFRHGHAWHGLTIGNISSQGKGYGVDIVKTTMSVAFDDLRLNRLDGAIIEYNEPSKKLYCGKLGWTHYGTRSNYFYRNGKFHNQLLVGITAAEYRELHGNS